ncbi:MAG: serine/threonine-protein kinase [Acidobacteria bacterium]|nr:serine/threonine-protein kinase [Acidobacteriota bacterium]
MPIPPGTRLGPHDILAPLGAGGMGEVYRARDTRLDREVAVKVLPAHLSQDADARARFEREAKSVAALSHPNILAIHDFGQEGTTAYAVTELLEGETLRERMGGAPMPARKAIDAAQQIVQGLAAAHDKGVVHRDLKPENIWVTKDGRIKILDFGLAKTASREGADLTSAPTAQQATTPGTVMGTAGYMSPEQVRGKPVDSRTDIFSFGAILYEMVAGTRPFRGETTADTMSAILKEDPPELTKTGRSVPPGLERIVHHCLEKSPEERFQSARDVAFALQSLSTATGSTAQPAVQGASRVTKRGIASTAVLLMVAAAAAGGWMAGSRGAVKAPPAWHRLTFRRGTVWSARFAPDGKTIVYGAAFEGKPVELFMTRPESPESKPLGFPKTDILSISSAGELAIMSGAHTGTWGYGRYGTLARMPLVGGSPRPILDDVYFADWSPDGKDLAASRLVGGLTRIEYPIGTVVRESVSLVNPRVSPDGTLVAFFDSAQTSSVSVSVVDKAGKTRALTSGWGDWWYLCWSPDGKEVWFASPEPGASANTSALYAVDLSGKVRLLARVPGTLELHDVSKDGRALVGRVNYRGVLRAMLPGDPKERDLSWLDASYAADISIDGRILVLTERGEGGGAGSSIYVRNSDGGAATLIGEGNAFTLSPDGKWVLSRQASDNNERLSLLPTGAGNPVAVKTPGLVGFNWGNWFPDGRRLLLDAREANHAARLYVVPVDGGTAKAISPEGFGLKAFGRSISPDGKLVAAIDPNGLPWLFPTEGGDGKPIAGMAAGEVPLQWSTDGRSLYIVKGGEVPGRVWRLDLATAKRDHVVELSPADLSGVTSLEAILITPDGRSYAYSYHNNISDLYLVDGLK